MDSFKTSRFNFSVPLESGALLFNAATGKTLKLSGPDGVVFSQAVSGTPQAFPADCVDDDLEDELRAGGFIVPARVDETAAIRASYWDARNDTPMVVTITTTMECNLGCYYCYESRSDDSLSTGQLPTLLAWVRERLVKSGRKRLHVDWYGGEPLLNRAFLEAASSALQALCAELGVTYQASVISNGTLWPDNVEDFVRSHRIGQVQISFDGLRAHHDRRRRYRREYLPGHGEGSSFDRAVALVDRLVRLVRVDLRFNIDQKNADDLVPFLDFCTGRGWFSAPFPAVFQPARLASYSERSDFMRGAELPLDRYDALRKVARDYLDGKATVEEAEAPDGYPYPRTSVCAALASDSIVVGGDGLAYRCGLQVGERHRAVGSLANNHLSGIPITVGAESERQWWERFDPCDEPTCSRCSFLPICWGGCPKKHLEHDRHALEEQGAYWRANLARLVAHKAGESLSVDLVYGTADQFR